MTDPMTDPEERIVEIEERLEAATDGPWDTDPKAGGVYPDTGEVWAPMDGGPLDYRIVCRTNEHFQPGADATFIAHAPEDIAYLLEVARAVEPLFDGEGSYAGSPAENIERLVDEHGSEIMQEIVSQHFAQVRKALHGEAEDD